MNTKTIKILYWVFTALFCAVFAYSASMYFSKTDMIKGAFEFYDYPSCLVYPLAILKVLGIAAIVSRKVIWLKEWAYAGFFFDAVLALFAHLHAEDGGQMFAVVALVGIVVSRVLEPMAFPQKVA